MDLGMGDLSIGVSQEGMTQYLGDLKVSLLDNVSARIEDVANLEASIDKGWQGESRMAFKKEFEKARTELNDALSHEYDDLKSRLDELVSSYYAQDQAMADYK